MTCRRALRSLNLKRLLERLRVGGLGLFPVDGGLVGFCIKSEKAECCHALFCSFGMGQTASITRFEACGGTRDRGGWCGGRSDASEDLLLQDLGRTPCYRDFGSGRDRHNYMDILTWREIRAVRGKGKSLAKED